MEAYDATGSTDITSVIPQGLIENQPEKNVGPSQMAEFSTPLDEIAPPSGPAGLQNMVMGAAGAVPVTQAPQAPTESPAPKKIPFGLTHEQYMAVLAGLAAVVATSKQVQERLAQLVPNVEPGTTYAMFLTALVAALVFYLANKFL